MPFYSILDPLIRFIVDCVAQKLNLVCPHYNWMEIMRQSFISLTSWYFHYYKNTYILCSKRKVCIWRTFLYLYIHTYIYYSYTQWSTLYVDIWHGKFYFCYWMQEYSSRTLLLKFFPHATRWIITKVFVMRWCLSLPHF